MEYYTRIANQDTKALKVTNSQKANLNPNPKVDLGALANYTNVRIGGFGKQRKRPFSGQPRG